jgi:hypothetical protein
MTVDQMALMSVDRMAYLWVQLSAGLMAAMLVARLVD